MKRVRAVALDAAGRPTLTELPEPDGEGQLVRVRACGLCGSDVEKIGDAAPTPGTVLGHEVVGEVDGRRVVLVHHLPCGDCDRCRAGHESTCEHFGATTIVPGGFAELARARETLPVPEGLDDAVATMVEPLACILRGAERVPRGRVLVVGLGFIGSLFAQVLTRRGDEVYGDDPRPERVLRSGVRAPDTDVDAAVLCAPAGAGQAVGRVSPGGTVLAFAPAGRLDVDAVYRRELHLVGSRSATPRHMRAAIELLPSLDPPPVEIFPLERFQEGLDRYRSGEALKVVFVP